MIGMEGSENNSALHKAMVAATFGILCAILATATQKGYCMTRKGVEKNTQMGGIRALSQKGKAI